MSDEKMRISSTEIKLDAILKLKNSVWHQSIDNIYRFLF